MSRIFRILTLFLLVLFFALIGGYWGVAKYGGSLADELGAHLARVWHGTDTLDGGKTPSELIRYAKRRLEGHPKVELIALPVLDGVQSHFERPIPMGNLPTFLKGQQPLQASSVMRKADYYVSSSHDLSLAVRNANAGQIIEIRPGRYPVSATLVTAKAGNALQPIIIRAAKPGEVIIEFDLREGFQVVQPYWVFENLVIKGVCTDRDSCEHAFHIMGNAHHTIIRNNRIEDFSAHLKINGSGGEWPDSGLLEFNTLTNSHRRETSLPVTPFDLVGANGWVVSDNLVSNFVAGGPSFGIYMKGAGRGGRVERNLVICTTQDISQQGTRVGISFGGGGTGKSYCRDSHCEAEYFGGIVRNNIVAHCNDFGIDVYRSKNTIVAHNTLINTNGIDVREAPASALVYGNLLDGKIRFRKGGQAKVEMNEIDSLKNAVSDPDSLQLSWKNPPERIPVHVTTKTDFCGRARQDGTYPGALNPEGECQ